MVSLQKESAAAHKAVTLRDVEEGAVTLRKVGESLAGLKGEKKRTRSDALEGMETRPIFLFVTFKDAVKSATIVSLWLRRVPSPADQNAGGAEGGGGGGQVPEGGTSQAGQHAEEGEEPDGHAQQSAEVRGRISQRCDEIWNMFHHV